MCDWHVKGLVNLWYFIFLLLFFHIFFYFLFFLLSNFYYTQWMRTDLSIFCKFKSPFSCENRRFNAWLSIPPFDSVSFHALEKAFLTITLWESKKLVRSTLELIKKNGIVITISSIHSMSSNLSNDEKENNEKKQKKSNLGP